METKNIFSSKTGIRQNQFTGYPFSIHMHRISTVKMDGTYELKQVYNHQKSFAMLEKARTSHGEGKLTDAYSLSIASLKYNTENVSARKQLAYTLQLGGYADEAIEQYQQAEEIQNAMDRAQLQKQTAYFINKMGTGPMVMMRNNKALHQSLNGRTVSKTDINQLDGLRHMHTETRSSNQALRFFGRVAWIILFLLCISPGLIAQSLDEPITISGLVSSHPHPVHPTTTVKAKDPQTGYTYGSTTTDANGFYSLEVIVTGIDAWHTTAATTAPNPFTESTQLSWQATHSGRHTLRVLNALGQTVLQQDFDAGQGDMVSIGLHGLGEAGMYIAHISGAQGAESFRLLQAQTAYQKQIEINVQPAAVNFKNAASAGVRLVYEADDHQQKDTLLSQQNHSNVDVTISQNPQVINSSYTITLTNDVMNQGVVASVQVRNHETDEFLFSGNSNSNGVFSTTFQNHVWEWPGLDPIYEITSLRTDASASHHNALQRVDDYAQNMSLSSVMTQIMYSGNASLSVSLTSLPLSYGPSGALVDVLHNGSSVASGSTNNGSASIGIPYNYYQNGSNVLNLINGSPVTSLDMDVSHAVHEPASFSRSFSTSMSLIEDIYQIPEQGQSDITVDVTSLPFDYGPTGASVELVDDDTSDLLDSGSTVNGVFTGSFTFDFWEHEDLYEATINNVGVGVTLSDHSSYDSVVPNQSQTVPVILNQNPSVGTTIIDLYVENSPFNYGITGANATFRNADNNEIVDQGTTVNGDYSASISFNYWEHEGDVISELENILYEVTKSNHTSANGTIANQSQPLNLVLDQIPQSATANISGLVTDANTSAPINQVLVEVKNPSGVNMTSTNTNVSGNYNTNVNYQLLVNETNPDDVITIPEHITLRFSKDPYTPHQTSPINLEASIVHNQALSQAYENFSFTIKPYTADNAEMNQVLSGPFTLFVKNVTTNVTESFSQSGTNPITINIEGSSTSDQLKIWHNHVELADLIVIEDPSMPWNALNIAQNRPVREWTHGMPFDTLTTTVAAVVDPAFPNKEMYIPRYSYQTHNGVITFNSNISMTMLADRGGTSPNRIKNYKVSHAPHIESFFLNYIVPPSGDWNNNSTPLPPSDLAQMMTFAENIDICAVSASGRQRMPIVYTVINGPSDPAWQAAVARGWDYSKVTWREQSTQPGNGILIDAQNWRIKNGINYNVPNAPQGATFEEYHEVTAGIGNAPNNTPSSNYTGTVVNGQVVPNIYGKTVVSVSAMLNPWTEVLTSATTSLSYGTDFEKHIEPSVVSAKVEPEIEHLNDLPSVLKKNPNTVSWNSVLNDIYQKKSETSFNLVYDLVK